MRVFVLESRVSHQDTFREAMSLRIRRAKPSDFPGAMRLIEPDRALFPEVEWRRLPALLSDLLDRDRLIACVVEETDGRDLRFLAASGFLNPQVREAVLANSSASATARLFVHQRRFGNALLNRRQVAEANRRGGLSLVNMFGTVRHLVAGGASLPDAAGRAMTAWTFFHWGFDLREIILETADELQASFFSELGARSLRASAGRGRPFLFQMVRDDALRTPAKWPFFAMVRSEPRFGFTNVHQQVLELALLDFSDREIVADLALTEDTLKKRWRSIYRAVTRVEPALLVGKNGPDARRAVLQSLRNNLVELRPFR
jgi:hypothetical protein